jgi:hypothetical protein
MVLLVSAYNKLTYVAGMPVNAGPAPPISPLSSLLCNGPAYNKLIYVYILQVSAGRATPISPLSSLLCYGVMKCHCRLAFHGVKFKFRIVESMPDSIITCYRLSAFDGFDKFDFRSRPYRDRWI